MSLSKDFSKIYTIGGYEVKAEILPCSWMYPLHELQITVYLMATGEKDIVSSRVIGEIISFEAASELHVDAMVEKAVYLAEPCKCGKPRMRVRGREGETKRGVERCETCFSIKFTEDREKGREKERKRLALRDAEKEKEGFSHKLTFFIHGDAGDRHMDVYFKGEPTEAEITKRLRGSQVKDDFQLIVLPPSSPEEKKAHMAAVANKIAKKHGLPPDVIGMSVVIGERTYTVASIASTPAKSCVTLLDANGKRYTCSAGKLRRALNL